MPYGWHSFTRTYRLGSDCRRGCEKPLAEFTGVETGFQASSIEQLLSFIDLLPTPSIVALDPDGRTVRMNRAFTTLLEVPSDDAPRPVGSARPYTYMHNGEPLERYELPLWRALRGESVRDFEMSAHLQSGRVVHLWGSAAPLYNEKGHITGSIATYIDITQRRELEALNERNRLELDALRDEERRSAARLAYLAETGQALSESLDIRAVLDALTRILVPRFADCVSVTLQNEQGELYPAKMHFKDEAVLRRLVELRARSKTGPQSFPVTSMVMQTGRGVLIDIRDAATYANADAAYIEFLRALQDVGLDRCVLVPLKNRGVVSGVFAAFSSSIRRYNDSDLQMLEELGRRAASALDNARLFQRERRVSETLQDALLPPGLPTCEGLALDYVYVPGNDEAQIGGDWYDAFDVPDGRMIVSIGDVTGQGLQAAVIMSKVRQAIKALSLYETDPTKLLQAADAHLRRTHPAAIVTAVVGAVDAKAGTFSFATAGHAPPLLRRADGSIVELPAHGLPLGLRTADEPSSVTVRVGRGDLILLYTDGLTESTHDLLEGERRTIAAMQELRADELDEAAHIIHDRVLESGSRDDVALLSVHIVGTGDNSLGGAHLAWQFDTTDVRLAHESRRLFRRFLLDNGAVDDDCASGELIFGELIGNVVRHASGLVDIEADWTGERPVLRVADRGVGYDHNHTLPEDPLSESGRGLFLIEALTHAFAVERLPQGGTRALAELNVRRTR